MDNNNNSTFAGAGYLIQAGLGAELTAASSITVTDSLHVVSGSTTITTINGGGSYNSAFVYLIKKSGATWQFGSGGNITGQLPTAVPANCVVSLAWDSSTSWRIAGIGSVGSLLPTPDDYGAVGDGTTDDSTALYAALAAAITAEGALLLLPGKTYRVTQAYPTITTNGWQIIGVGGGESLMPKIKVDGNFTLFTLGDNSHIVEAFKIEGIAFQGVNGGSSQRAINVTYAKNGEIVHNDFRTFANIPIYASGGSAASTFGLKIHDNFFVGNTHGAIYLSSPYGTCGSSIKRNTFNSNTLTAPSDFSIVLIGYTEFILERNIYEDGVTPESNAAVYMSAMVSPTALAEHCESTAYMIWSATTNEVTNARVSGCLVSVQNTAMTGIYGNTGGGSIIEGCSFINSGGTAGTAVKLASLTGFRGPVELRRNGYDGIATEKNITGYPYVDNDGLTGLFYTQTANSTAIASTASQTAFSKVPPALLANSIRKGDALLTRAAGSVSSTGSPNLTLEVCLGGTTLASFAFSSIAAGPSNWTLEVEIVNRDGNGAASGFRATRATASVAGTVVGSTSSAAAVGINTTVSLQPDIRATWSASDAANTITMQSQTWRIEHAGSNS